jgi:hypothetical protein
MAMSFVGYVVFWACVVLLVVTYLELRYGRLLRRLLVVLIEEAATEDGHVRELCQRLKECLRRTTAYTHDDI